jgi:hypothetical protein
MRRWRLSGAFGPGFENIMNFPDYSAEYRIKK